MPLRDRTAIFGDHRRKTLHRADRFPGVGYLE
jgi:hypothetical protein